MIVAAWPDYLVTAPAAFVAGLLIGYWIGGRFDIRRKRDA